MLAEEHTVTAVLTHPDTYAGRGRRKAVNPVKAEAESLGIPIIEAVKIDDNVITDTKTGNPELLVVVAFGKLFPKNFLELFPKGAINLHPSLLPKYRGPSPATAAIVNGDEFTGITIQLMNFEMDTGDILTQEKFPLTGKETTGSLLAQIAAPGAHLLVRAIREYSEGTLSPIMQSEKDATYCRLIKKEDGHINWNESAVTIERKVRAYDPWPGTFTLYDDKKLIILGTEVISEVSGSDIPVGSGDSGKPEESKEEAASADLSLAPGSVLGIDKKEGILIQTGNGVLAVNRLQLQAKKALDWKSFINGNRQFIRSKLL